MSALSGALAVRIKSITHEADDVIALELRPVAGDALPEFAAGAHIDLRLPNGIERSYSLANPQGERGRYLIGVQKDAASRGGSRFVHDTLRAGDVVSITPPRNNFPLVEDTGHVVLIAGGIGVTPIWCMVQRLVALGRSWDMFYAARSRRRAGFLDAIAGLRGLAARHVHLHFDDERGGVLDVAAVVRAAPPGSHFYCCGPLPMLAVFEQATAALPAERVHVEYFTAKGPIDTGGGFEVVLARSGRTVAVPAGKTILDALADAGIPVRHSCLEGVCGTCETTVIEGIPDHRDMVLSPQERASNRTIMICCSRAKGERLVLDL